MKIFKLMSLLLLLVSLTACSGNQVDIMPTEVPTIISSTDETPINQYHPPYEIQFGSDEYNYLLENYVYGKWVVSKVIIEPVEIMDKKVQDLIIGSKVEFGKTRIVNDFTDEKLKLARPYQNEARQSRKANTEIKNPKYIIQNLYEDDFYGGGSYLRQFSRLFEFEDFANVKSITVFEQDGGYRNELDSDTPIKFQGDKRWNGLGHDIAIRDKDTLILDYETGFWELKRVE